MRLGLLVIVAAAACGPDKVASIIPTDYNDSWNGTMHLSNGQTVAFVLDIFKTPITTRHESGRVFFQLHVGGVVFGGLGGGDWHVDPRSAGTENDPARLWVDLLVVGNPDPLGAGAEPRVHSYQQEFARLVEAGALQAENAPTTFFQLIGENTGEGIEGGVYRQQASGPVKWLQAGTFSATRVSPAAIEATRESQIETERFLFETDYTKRSCPECANESIDGLWLK